MASILVEVIGWIGAALILIAYFLITARKVTGNSKLYQGMNLIGSVMVGANALINRAYPSTAINVFWIFIAIYGLVRVLPRHHPHHRAH